MRIAPRPPPPQPASAHHSEERAAPGHEGANSEGGSIRGVSRRQQERRCWFNTAAGSLPLNTGVLIQLRAGGRAGKAKRQLLEPSLYPAGVYSLYIAAAW